MTERLSKKRRIDDMDWVEGHCLEYEQLKLRWGMVHPVLQDVQSEFWPTTRNRERDVLAVCAQLYPVEYNEATKSGDVKGRDVSQSMKRRVGCSTKFLSDDTTIQLLPTVMPQWRFWITTPGFNRILAPKEAFVFRASQRASTRKLLPTPRFLS